MYKRKSNITNKIFTAVLITTLFLSNTVSIFAESIDPVADQTLTTFTDPIYDESLTSFTDPITEVDPVLDNQTDQAQTSDSTLTSFTDEMVSDRVVDSNSINSTDLDFDSSLTSFTDPILESALTSFTDPYVDKCTTEVVSDTSNQVVGGSFAVSTYAQNPRWTASIPGATWIWKTFFVPNPTQDETQIFTKTFSVTSAGTVDSASLVVAADNSYTVSVNGTQIGSDNTETNYFDSDKDTYNVASNLVSGSNTISFTVKNWALASSTAELNPAGLLYKLTIKTHDSICEAPINTPPTITLIGANPLNITVNTLFVDPGATATDTEDGDLTNQIVKTGTVNASTTGTYTLTYSVTDSGGLSANATRTVVVSSSGGGGDSCVDKTPTGSISVDGKNATLVVPTGACPVKISFSSYTFKETIRPFDEQVLVDNITAVYGPGTHEIGPINVACKWQSDIYGGDVQTNLNPDYGHSNLIFSIFDENPGCNTPPVITLIGPNPDSINVGQTFIDHGATAIDEEDGNITGDIITTGSVNTEVSGTYILTYSVTDSGGLSATTTRTVNVNPVVCTSNCGGGGSNSPTVTLTADPSSITVGATSTLSWTSANTNSCSAVWTTATSTSGSQDVAPGATTDYSISCTGTNGTVSATTTVTVTTIPINPPGGGGGGGGGSSNSGGRRHDISSLLAPQGEVLGATSCYYLRDFLKIDWKNDPIEVLKLQSFLNVFEKESLSLTGVFDRTTFDAVERFQIKYNNDILIPWGDKVTTGFVYILTKKKVNEIYCNSLFPVSASEQAEIDAFRSFGGSGDNFVGVGQSTANQGYAIEVSNEKNANLLIIDLANATSSNQSVVRNMAVSLFALSQKIFSNIGYLIVLLILLAVVVAIIYWLSRSSKDPKNSIVPIVKITDKDEPPVIILPGVSPDEEIIIENPEEESEEVLISTPDLRDKDKKTN